jgi:hypothetical protein
VSGSQQVHMQSTMIGQNVQRGDGERDEEMRKIEDGETGTHIPFICNSPALEGTRRRIRECGLA